MGGSVGGGIRLGSVAAWRVCTYRNDAATQGGAPGKEDSK
jgi:hypothetical protein